VSEIHKFLFEGLPVRGVLVRLSEAWVEILRRRAANTTHGAYPVPVQNLLGEMTAAAVLMQSNIKFNGALIVQIFGDGPVKLAVVEVNPDFGLRATATVNAAVQSESSLSQLVNVGNEGRCAITLDPLNRLPGQQPYQGVVTLFGDAGEKLEKLSDILQHYMLQSEQLDTMLVLAANEQVAAGLLIQRLPSEGVGNLTNQVNVDDIGFDEHYNRIAILASSLKSEELLTLDAESILRRLFCNEKLLRFEPLTGSVGPHFLCSCSRDRVSKMIVDLGAQEAQSILNEHEMIEVGCDFCGAQYRFDAIDVEQMFCPVGNLPPASAEVQ
jgi:molecular chaperone Hsp33